MLNFMFYGAVGFVLVVVLWELVKHFAGRAIALALGSVLVLMPTLAFADDFSGAGPIIAAIAERMPQPYATWFVTLVAVLGLLSMGASGLRSVFRPPADTDPRWKIVGYRVLLVLALDFGWARNLVLPGQPKAVQEAMMLTAKVVAQAPEVADAIMKKASV